MAEQLPQTPLASEQSQPVDTHHEAYLRQESARKAEEQRLIEAQLDTEELVAGLGAVGLGRLKHPFKNARILAIAAWRMNKGEYDPRLLAREEEASAPTPGEYFDPFTRDPVSEARHRRVMDRYHEEERRRWAEERRRLIESGKIGQYFDPFED